MQFSIADIARSATLTAALVLSSEALALEGSGAEWGARDPGGCTSIQLDAAPTTDQVVAMLRCKHEVALATGELWLMENIKVGVSASTPFVEAYGDYVMEDGDVDSSAYNIRGSFSWVVCITKLMPLSLAKRTTIVLSKIVPEAKVCAGNPLSVTTAAAMWVQLPARVRISARRNDTCGNVT